MTTLSAFALDFTDYRKVTLGYNTPTESNDAKLSVTDNGDGTYNVTFNDIITVDGTYTDNYGTFTFSNVSGSTSGDVTTVTATDVTGTVSGGTYNITEFTKGNLSLKFKDGKAYATMTATCRVFYSNYTFDVVFGTDEGFDGGGSTGGGEVAAPFEKVDFVGDGTNFNWSIPVNWDTQKIVMSISTATCTTGCEHIIGLGTDGTSWAGNLHMYRTSNDQQLQCYFGAGAINTGKFAEGNPIKVEISKANGLVVDGTTRITAAQLADLFAMSTVVMGTGEGSNILSHATYNYVKVVDKDWTEVPPVTVVDTKEFKNVAYTTSMGGNGTATVTFTEMSDGTFPMTFVSDDLNVKAENLTKGTDAKGRTTYTGQAVNDAASTVTYTVNAVVYTEGAEKKLYMTMVSVDGTTFTVGEDPDHVAPEPEIEGTVVEGSKSYAANGSKFEWSNIAINWNKQKLVAVIDLSSCTGTSENILSVGQNIGSWSIGGWHFYYTVASKKMKSDYLATDGAHPVSDPKTGVEPGTVRIELSKAEGCTIDGVSYNALYDSSVTGTWQSNTEDFWNLTSVNIGSKEGANRSNAVIKYVTVVDLPVTVKDEKTFNEALYMVQGTTSTKVADAKVVVKEMSDNTINMSLQFNGNEYTSTELTKGTDDKNRTTYTGKVSKDTQTFDVAGVVYEKETADRLYMTMTAAGVTFVVGENPDAVTPEVTEVSNKTYTSNLRILMEKSQL